jgi:hypothetical protein
MAEIIANEDSSAIVKLSEPIRVGKEELTRVTIPKIRGRHMFKAPVMAHGMPIGPVIEWASHIVIPAGAVEEMCPKDAIAVANWIMEHWAGKSIATGETGASASEP